MVEIKQISAIETYDIRRKVLRNGIDLPFEFEQDFDENTIHIGAFLDGRLVGIATAIVKLNNNFRGKQYQLRGMATLEEVRGNGFGKKIVEELIFILQEKKINILWCNAREEAVLFYKKLNFKKQGEKFMVNKVGFHYQMWMSI